MDKYEYLWMLVRNNKMPADISMGEYDYLEIMKMDEERLMNKLGIRSKQAQYIASRIREFDIDKEYDEFLASDIKSVTKRENEYPDKLKYIDNCPYALFYLGDLPDSTRRSVAIIGARECSEYGRIMAESLAGGLAKKGIDVISGMAYGIDGISQMKAIESGGSSYGVLGCGVEQCYPRANKPLYELLKRHGGVISEYPLKASGTPDNFPMRNRIISGLSDVLVVVEARLRSGTFITVDYALSQGREIMVVPGRATDSLSVGCNALMFQGAYPAQSADDIIRLLNTIPNDGYLDKNSQNEFRTKELKNYVPKQKEKILLEREENLVYSVLDFYALSPEEISGALKMDIFQVMSILISLEMKGVIKEMGKNSYVKCH